MLRLIFANTNMNANFCHTPRLVLFSTQIQFEIISPVFLLSDCTADLANATAS